MADYLADWSVEETEAANSGETKHLWEESWDDDDTSDDFSQQLKYVTPLLPTDTDTYTHLYMHKHKHMHMHSSHSLPIRGTGRPSPICTR